MMKKRNGANRVLASLLVVGMLAGGSATSFAADSNPPQKTETLLQEETEILLQEETETLLQEETENLLQEDPQVLPVLRDPDGSYAKISAENGLPVTYLLDINGRLCYRFNGAKAWTAPHAVARLEEMLHKDKP